MSDSRVDELGRPLDRKPTPHTPDVNRFPDDLASGLFKPPSRQPLDVIGGALALGKVTLISEQPEQLRLAILEIDRLRAALMKIRGFGSGHVHNSFDYLQESIDIAKEALSK